MTNLSINSFATKQELKEQFKQAVDSGLIKEIINVTFKWSAIRPSKKDETVTLPISKQIDKIPDGGCALIWYIERDEIQMTPVKVIFQTEYQQTPIWTPSTGVDCEYQIRPDVWIPCHIIGGSVIKGRWIAEYINDTGQSKVGCIDNFNLRPQRTGQS